ncbi:MAG: thioredoxin-disulfide reductase [Oscillospiraceae bacterium]|nr:thioredoxin-disulfide reductase [Oscillospiraceae bacterium]
MNKTYDVIIIGAGPAGLSAALYAGRARLSTLLIEKEREGGQIVTTSEVENYPGNIEHESGQTLIARMSDQATKFGAEKVFDTITELTLEGDVKVIKGAKGEYHGKTVIVATGAFPRKLGCPGEAEFTGKGVSYCATCDAAFFEDFEVYVVGGGNSAVEEAMFCAKYARKVTILNRTEALTAEKAIQEKVFAHPKVEIAWNTEVVELKGDGILTSMTLRDTVSGETREVEADEEDGTFGVFIFIGFVPNTALVEGKLTTERGYIVTDEDMRTNIPGVFAAGDLRKKTLRQVVTAAADGAIAATMCEHYLA